MKTSPRTAIEAGSALASFARRAAPMLVVTLGLSLPIIGVYARSARAQEPSASSTVATASVSASTSSAAPASASANASSGATSPDGDGGPKRGPVVDASRLRPHVTTTVERARSAFGVIALLGLCFAISRDRRRIDWRLVAIGTALQIVFALLILGSPVGRAAFKGANDGVVALLDYSKEGSKFLFASYLTGKLEPALINFAFNVLPSIVFFSSLMAVLYHLGVMQVLIRGIAWLMQRTMRTSGAETLSTAANIFVGQTEAPLLVRPFVATMTQSELLVVMAGGMANTAGGVLAAYVGMLYTFFPDIAGHLLAESIMSAPAALVTSKMIWPEDGEPVTRDGAKLEIPKIDANAIEAAARGASEGLALAFNVAAMLIAFIALVAMLDGGLAAITAAIGLPVITFQKIAGWLFYPFAWIMGVPTEDCGFVGQLLGQKIVLNEFVAYGTLSTALTTGAVPISARAVLIASYALSGFANVGSIGIQIGGIGSLAPERRGDVARLGALAVVAGSIATFMTACIAAVLGLTARRRRIVG